MVRLIGLLLVLGLPLRAEVYPALHEVRGVAAGDVLNIRTAPNAGAPVIGTLAPDAKAVEVVAVEQGWAVVNTGEGSGYASLRYLARTDAPDWNTLDAPLTCLGTEPFWSLQIDPVPAVTRLQTPEDDDARVAPMERRWPALPSSATAAVGLPDGTAVLTPAECSDGMSDQRYGIAVDVFLQGPGVSRLSGCCRLTPP